jgi:N-methylhydantoinase B
VLLTVRNDEMWLDYSGTDPQTATYVNAPIASSASASLMALLMLLGSDLPHNDGLLRPIHIDIPMGTILNCAFPAATFYGNFLSVHNSEAVMMALSQALPNRVTAGWNRPYVFRSSGLDPTTHAEYHDIHFLGYKGGMGAIEGADGYSQGAPIFAPALKTHDYELFEVQHPQFLLKHEYRTDSAGPGRWRGGLGVDYECRLEGDAITAATQGDGLLAGASGVHGGSSGAQNLVELLLPSGDLYQPHAMEILPDVPPGTVLHQLSGGGGGYGDPFDRDVEAVRQDVLQGYVSQESSRRDYGVVLRDTPNGDFVVDAEATRRLRQSRTALSELERQDS